MANVQNEKRKKAWGQLQSKLSSSRQKLMSLFSELEVEESEKKRQAILSKIQKS